MHPGIFVVLLLASVSAHAQVYRCDTPSGTTYQSHPCAKAAQQRELQDRVTVVPSGPSNPAKHSIKSPDTSGSNRTSVIDDTQKPLEAKQCARLRDRLSRIDTQARQRSTEALASERRKVRGQLHDLKCPLL